MRREQMEAAGYGFHHQSEDGKYLIMGNGTRAFAISAEPAPEKDNPLRTAEMTLEDDYGMIDGIINNGPKTPTVAELEAQVNAGQTISLMDLAAAVQVEKKDRPKSRMPKAKEQKPSILERLKQPLPKQANKTAPYRSAEMEI